MGPIFSQKSGGGLFPGSYMTSAVPPRNLALPWPPLSPLRSTHHLTVAACQAVVAGHTPAAKQVVPAKLSPEGGIGPKAYNVATSNCKSGKTAKENGQPVDQGVPLGLDTYYFQ